MKKLPNIHPGEVLLEEADFYIVIGYSFFDTYINNIILQGVNQDPDKKIIIVDI